MRYFDIKGDFLFSDDYIGDYLREISRGKETVMITHDPVQPNAIIVGLYIRGVKMQYSVWKGVVTELWYWSCASNNGSETTKTAAQEAARRWLRDGQ